ncbi:hypothetical protein CR513_62862, partial [Mucuna pruriens]
MSKIDPKVICHQLALCAKAKLVAQQKRKIDKDRCKAIEQEIAKLRVACFMREVSYTMWLSNVVLVIRVNLAHILISTPSLAPNGRRIERYVIPMRNRLFTQTSCSTNLPYLPQVSNVPLNICGDSNSSWIKFSQSSRIGRAGANSAGSHVVMDSVFLQIFKSFQTKFSKSHPA